MNTSQNKTIEVRHNMSWGQVLLQLQEHMDGVTIDEFDELHVKRGEGAVSTVTFYGAPRTLEFDIVVDIPFYDEYSFKGGSFAYFMSQDFTTLPYIDPTDDRAIIPIQFPEKNDCYDLSLKALGNNDFILGIDWYARHNKDSWFIYNNVGFLQFLDAHGIRYGDDYKALRFPGIVRFVGETSQLAYTPFTRKLGAPVPYLDITAEQWAKLDEEFHEVLVSYSNSNFAGERACRLCKSKRNETVISLDWVKNCPKCNNMTFDWALTPDGHQIPYLKNALLKIIHELGHWRASQIIYKDLNGNGKMRYEAMINLATFHGNASTESKTG